jgi:predicted ABC-type sugar transport system permease subunit
VTNKALPVSRQPSRWQVFVDEHRELVSIYGILLLIISLAAIISPDFRTSLNIFNVLRQAVALGLVSIGQTMVILSGGIDLSVGATISLIGVYTSGLMAGEPGLGVIVPIVLLMIGVGLAVGLVNSLLITQLKVALSRDWFYCTPRPPLAGFRRAGTTLPRAWWDPSRSRSSFWPFW